MYESKFQDMTSTLIHAYFHAFNAHDLEAMLETLHPDVAHDINEGEREIGLDKFRAFKNHMDECYLEQITDLVVMTHGNRGAAEFTCKGNYLSTDGGLPEASGQSYSIQAAVFFEISGDKISRITSYYSLAGWIAAIS